MSAGESPYLYLTTTGRSTGQPRRIEIWFTVHEGRYYLIAEHGDRAGWVRNIAADPRVAWTVGDARLTGRARPVDPSAEPALSRTIHGLSSAKYGWGDGLVVELTPDPGPPTDTTAAFEGRG